MTIRLIPYKDGRIVCLDREINRLPVYANTPWLTLFYILIITEEKYTSSAYQPVSVIFYAKVDVRRGTVENKAE